MPSIRIIIPYHLRNLAHVDSEVRLEIAPPVAIGKVLDALEEKFPVLRGTIRDHVTRQRRPFIRFFACQEDFSLHSPDAELPAAVVNGEEPLMIVGAMAGG